MNKSDEEDKSDDPDGSVSSDRENLVAEEHRKQAAW